MPARRWLWSRWIGEKLGLPLSRRPRPRMEPERSRRPPLVLEPLEDRFLPAPLVVNTSADTNAVNPAVSALDSSGNISLRSAIEFIDFKGGDQTISFDSTYFSIKKSINLKTGASYGALYLNDPTGTITIQGPAAGVVISGKNATEDFAITAGTGADFIGLTISGGSATSGGGIFNAGNLTLSGSTVADNFASNNGGGIDNTGTATISGGTMLSGNSSGNRGGAITNEQGGSLSISGSTISGNSSFTGGGLYAFGNSPSSVTINASTFSDNTASSGGGAIDNFGDATISGGSVISGNHAAYGGGIDNDSGDGGTGALTVTGSFITGNTATSKGGGLYNLSSATITGGTLVSDNYAGGNTGQTGGGIFNFDYLKVSASTISGNRAVNDGGGIENAGTVTITNSTLASNSAGGTGGGLDNTNIAHLSSTTIADNSAGTAGGINASGTTTLTNTLVALNQGTDPDVAGLVTGDHNLIGDGTGMTGISNGNSGNQVGSAGSTINPLLAPLGNYGGPTPTLAPLPGSPAIDTGGTTELETDQRGFRRVVNGIVDIGADESQGYTLQLVGGDNQSTALNTAFPQPLVVQVVPNNPHDPVAGALVTFTAPTSGPSASLSTSQVVIGGNGLAHVTATANSVLGSYVVTVSARGVPGSVSFHLNNIMAAPSPNCFIISVYLHLLGRLPLANELTYWTNVLNYLGDDVSGRSELVLEVEDSYEYRTDEVNQLYLQYLHRPATGDPLAQAWVNLLGLGWTLEDVAAQLVSSAEFILSQTDGSFGSWLNAFYLDTFQRPVDPLGFVYWSELFAQQESFAEIAQAIFTTIPLPGLLANEYHIALVSGYYPQFLERSAVGDLLSLNWMSLLQQRYRDQYIIAGILGGDEFYNEACTYVAPFEAT